MKKILSICLFFLLSCDIYKKKVDFKISVEIIRQKIIETDAFYDWIGEKYRVYSYLRSPIYIKKLNTEDVDTLGGTGEGPGKYRFIADLKVKNNRIFVAGISKLLIYSINPPKLLKELNIVKLSGFNSPLICDVINDSTIIVSATDYTQKAKKNYDKMYPILIIDFKNEKILNKFYLTLKHPDPRVVKLLYFKTVHPRNLFYSRDTVYAYDFIRDELIIYNINKNKEKRMKINHEGFTPPPPLQLEQREIKYYALPFNPPYGIFKKGDFIILFILNKWIDKWRLHKKVYEEKRDLKPEEMKEFDIVIDYISLKDNKVLGRAIFPDSLWKKERIVYYPSKVVKEDSIFSMYFVARKNKKLKVVYFKLKENAIEK